MAIIVDIVNMVVEVLGIMTLTLIVVYVTYLVTNFIKKIISKQTKIKCLCKHEYEPYSAFYHFNGIEYDFKCRKCGKNVSVDTVTRDKFKWIEDTETEDGA